MNAPALLSRRALLTLAAAGLLLTGGVAQTRPASPSLSVSLTIDYGDGSLKMFSELSWSRGTTVLDVMNAARAHARGITFQIRGSGATAIIAEIDGLKGETGGAKGRNWQLSINGNDPRRGFAAYELSPMDVIHWRFETQQRTQQNQGR